MGHTRRGAAFREALFLGDRRNGTRLCDRDRVAAGGACCQSCGPVRQEMGCQEEWGAILFTKQLLSSAQALSDGRDF